MPEGKIPSVRTHSESQPQPGTKGSEQSPQLHLGTARHSRWHWLSSITRSSTLALGTTKIQSHTLTDIPQIGILQILCKQLWEIPSAAGWILPSCCPTQEKSLNIIAPGTCFWQNPAQYLCLLLIFKVHCTFEGTDTSKCYMSYRDFALVGKTLFINSYQYYLNCWVFSKCLFPIKCPKFCFTQVWPAEGKKNFFQLRALPW